MVRCGRTGGSPRRAGSGKRAGRTALLGHSWASRWALALSDPQIGTALRAIHDGLARPWTVQELGAVAGLSRAAFARRFTELVAQPPMAYLTWWRLTTAARLLTTDDAPLARIAKQVGYASEYAFANAFKRESSARREPPAWRRLALADSDP
jgi:AraC-like DNA-binding protein